MCIHPQENHITDHPTFSLSHRLDLDGINCDYEDCSETVEIIKDESELNIIHYNVHGILNKQRELGDFLSNCGGKEIHVALLNETWLKKSNTERLRIQGFDYVGVPRPHKKGGGVGILISKQLKYRQVDIDDLNITGAEVCVIELKLSQDSITLVSLYRPPNNNVKCFLEDYKRLLDWLSLRKCPVILGCDHNLDLLKLESHRNTENFIDLILDHELLPCIMKPTRITKTSATLIDNIFVNASLYDKIQSSIMINDMSDHLPCRIIINDMFPLRNKAVTKNIRVLKKDKLEQIKDELGDIMWEKELNCMTSSNAFEFLNERLTDSIDKHLPQKEVNINRLKPSRPWLTSSIQRCISKSKRLYAKTLSKNSTPADYLKYKNYRNTLNVLKRKLMQMYFINKCTEFKQNGKKLWQIIRKATQSQNDKSSIIECLDIDNIKYYESKLIAEEFGQFFANIGRDYYNKIPKSKKSIDDYLESITNNETSLFLTPTSEIEIDRIISNLQSKNSHGHDGITNKIVKELKPALIKPLCIIFNISLSTGYFPDIYKRSDVVPLFKSKKRDKLTNYRPISLLPVLSKILEKIVYKRIYRFLEKNQRLYISQYGFRAKHSCENAITEFCSNVIKERENGSHTLSVFLDLSKAFDTLNHKLLLTKLQRYGIRGLALQWFKSYLENRTLRVKCQTDNGHVYSNSHKIEFGTPQGSCLGPLLFLIYSNDLHMHLNYTKCILFADDTTIYFSHKNLNYLKFCVETDLANILDWFKANGLTLNLDKSECVFFQSGQLSECKHVSVTVEGIKIPLVSATKFLGVWIDENLSWQKHTSNLIRKLKQNLKLLQLSRNMLDQHTKKILYYAQVFSHLKYGLLVWGNSITNPIKVKLQKLQNKAFVMIFNIAPTSRNYHEKKILQLKDQIKLENYRLVFDCLHDSTPLKIKEALLTDSNMKSLSKKHNYNTRKQSLPTHPKAKSNIYNNSFLCHSIRDYDALPAVTRKISSLPLFLASCKNLLYHDNH